MMADTATGSIHLTVSHPAGLVVSGSGRISADKHGHPAGQGRGHGKVYGVFSSGGCNIRLFSIK